MRTKALLGLAALAVSATTLMAQSSNVYSLNVVGYVNKAFKNGYFTLVSNPLNNGANDLQTIMPTCPDNTSVYRWSVTAQDLDPTIPTYSLSQSKWIPNATIAAGEGFFVSGGGDFTNTFVGEVRQGSTTVAIAGNQNAQMIASPVPITGPLATVLADYPATDNDIVMTWNVTAQDVDPAVPTYSQLQGKWVPDATVTAGDGFFLIRAGSPVNWVRTFNVP